MRIDVMRTKLSTIVSGLVFALVVPVGAHHSAAEFDFRTPVEVKGVVKEIRVANPHMRLIMSVTDGKGTRDVEFEGHSRNNIFRSGWRENMVKPGDAITIRIAPRRAGGDGGYVQSVTTASGQRF
jgi:hypothetical protein